MSHNTAGDGLTPHERMVAMLADPCALFDRSQVAYLMRAQARWSREEAEERAHREGEADGHAAAMAGVQAAIVAAGPVQAFSEHWHRMEGYRRRARREHDTAAVHPWRGDHPGGPVPVWEDPERGARIGAYNARLKAMDEVRP